MIVCSLFLALVVNLIHGKSVISKNSCDPDQVSFFVIDNAFINSDNSIVYKDTSEDECLNSCSENEDQFKKPIICNSFTYDHASLTCTINKEKAVPSGSVALETAIGKRYFEKICLPKKSQDHCHKSQFIRVDQSVLVGYAVNMTLTDSIESCVSQCVQEMDCKSAMYFYEDGECITNKESALTKPAGFTREENDRVIYFQNGCDIAKVGTADTASDEPKRGQMDSKENDNISKERPNVNIQISETTPKPVEHTIVDKQNSNSNENKDETEYVEEDDEGTDNVEEEEENDDDDDDDQPSTEATEATTPLIITTTPESIEESTTKKIKALIQKKIKKHPKNFGSKTYEILKKQEIVKNSKIDTDSIKETDDSLSSEDIEKNYFSEWSDWTPCTKSNERQVRRRRCLNLRKCLGALMQVQNCPEIIQTTTSENREMVRSIVTVDGEEYDDPITVDNITVDPHPSRVLPVLHEQVWGSWQGSCQQFASSQPCNNGNMIGFESRECIAKNPSQCEGPFFRYCTLSC